MKEPITKIIVGLFIISIFTGCASTNKSRVPGLEGKAVADLKPVRTSDVLIAIKAELAAAFVEIEKIKKDPKNKTKPVDAFEFKEGNGKLKGSTTVVKQDGATVNAVIPITVFSGSTMSPDAGFGFTTTSIETTTLDFSIDPQIDKKKIMPNDILEGIQIRGYLRDAIVAAYCESIAMPVLNEEEGFHPTFTNNNLQIFTSFAVVRSLESGISSTLIVPAIDLDRLLPSLSVSDKKSRVYDLTINLPLNTPNAGDPRRLLYGKTMPNGKVAMIDAPYSEGLKTLIEKNYQTEVDDFNERRRLRAEGVDNVPNEDEIDQTFELLTPKRSRSY